MPDQRHPDAGNERRRTAGGTAGPGPSRPIIFITAFPEERLRRQVEAAGAVGFLSKPFDARALMACGDLHLTQR
ncbi:MAG: hypothetical protein U1E66_03035 [Rhodospirillales bacterium]